MSNIKVYENVRSHPSGTKNCKVSMHTLVTTAHLVRPVPPNINKYPMGRVADVQVNAGIVELNKIKHILGSPIPIELFIDLNSLSWTLSILGWVRKIYSMHQFPTNLIQNCFHRSSWTSVPSWKIMI